MQGFPRIFTAFIFAPLICFDRENDMASCPILYERRGGLPFFIVAGLWTTMVQPDRVVIRTRTYFYILYLKNILLFCAYGILCLFFTFIYIHIQRKKIDVFINPR